MIKAQRIIFRANHRQYIKLAEIANKQTDGNVSEALRQLIDRANIKEDSQTNAQPKRKRDGIVSNV